MQRPVHFKHLLWWAKDRIGSRIQDDRSLGNSIMGLFLLSTVGDWD